MNYYALLYDLVDDMVTRRAPYREEHLRLARESRQRDELVLAGALTDPVDRALLVFRAPDKTTVEDFARKDPYVVNSLAKKWEVRQWNVVVGGELASPSATPSSRTVLRRWSARTSDTLLPKYLDHFSKSVLPELRRVEGFIGANVATRHGGGEAEVVVETSWRSLDSIRSFAGSDVEAAVVAPEAAALLTDYDRRVRHYEIAVSA